MEIIIVGAGIAGLSAGIGLRRAGHKVTILERSSLLQEVGAAILIAPNATKVLQSWDFNPTVSKMVTMKSVSLENGTTLEVVAPNHWKYVEQTYGVPMYSVHRVDLHNQLRLLATQNDGSGYPVDIQVHSEVVEYDAMNGKVTLANSKVLQADLIVAADGVHSKAVEYVLSSEETRARDTGWATMRWLISTEELISDPDIARFHKDSTCRYFIGSRNTGGLVWYPCRNNKVQNFLYLSRSFDSSHAKEDFRATIEPSVLIDYAKKDFAPILQSIIGKAKDVKFWKLVARDPLPTWHKGKLILIGDAAHPMLPFQAQGGGQAIEDGGALGVFFDQLQSKEKIEERLRLFEQIRRNRGSSLQVLSNASHPTPQSVRDEAAKYLPAGKKLDTQDDVNDYIFSFDAIKESKAVA